MKKIRLQNIVIPGMPEYNEDNIDKHFMERGFLGGCVSPSFLYFLCKSKEWIDDAGFEIYRKLVAFDIDRLSHVPEIQFWLIIKFAGFMPNTELFEKALLIFKVEFNQMP